MQDSKKDTEVYNGLLDSEGEGAGSFPMSQLFASGGQSIEASALASVLPVTIQD